MAIILRNAVECKRCGYLLESKGVHDYRTHSCDKSIWFMVDGGHSYLRRGWSCLGGLKGPYIERSIEVDTRIYDRCLVGY